MKIFFSKGVGITSLRIQLPLWRNHTLHIAWVVLNRWFYRRSSERESANCHCGEVERRKQWNNAFYTVTRYEEEREKLIQEMFLLSGSILPNLEIFLTVGNDEDNRLTETERLRLLAQYIEDTERCFPYIIIIIIILINAHLPNVQACLCSGV